MIIGITGASGQLARRTADLVLEHVEPSNLVLVTRDPSKLADYAARGVSVRQGDFDQPDGLPAAFAGIDRLLLISASDLGRRVLQHVAAIESARTARVGHIVYTSIVNPTPNNPSVAAQEHLATEAALRASGLRWTFLRHSIYADIQARFLLDALPSGRYVHNYGEGMTAFVARDDCAAVAAAVLHTDGHASQAYDVTGREPFTHAETATILASETGTELPVTAVDDDDRPLLHGSRIRTRCGGLLLSAWRFGAESMA